MGAVVALDRLLDGRQVWRGQPRGTARDAAAHPTGHPALDSRLPGGGCNEATMHHALKVRKGRKYVITQWYREQPWAG